MYLKCAQGFSTPPAGKAWHLQRRPFLRLLQDNGKKQLHVSLSKTCISQAHKNVAKSRLKFFLTCVIFFCITNLACRHI